MDHNVEFRPIGAVHSPVVNPVDDVWGGVTCRIDIDPSQFTAESLAGLAEFSHV